MQSSHSLADSAPPLTLSFLLLAGFSEHSLQVALAPLQQFNEAFEQPPVKWQLLCADPARHSLCQQLSRRCDDYQFHKPRHLILCAGQAHWLGAAPEMLCWLRQLQRSGCTFYSIGGGCQVLASAGLLSDAEVSVGGAVSQQLRQRYPETQIAETAYSMDWSRCAAGSSVDSFAAGAMLLEILAHSLPPGDAQQLAQQQREGATTALDPRLARARALMLSKLEAPLSTGEIAAQLALSARQLERLFQRDLQRSPGRYYLELRLQHAREQVRYARLSMAQIAQACGFKSLSHFSRSYSKHFDINPKRERLRWQRAA